MSHGSPDPEIKGRNRRVYLIGAGETVPDDLCRRLETIDSVPPVSVLDPASVPEGLDDDPAAGVVCLDGSRSPATSDGPQTDSLVAAVAATGVDCPVVVVGADVDGAAAYEAGATDIVPLAAGDHAETVAERIATIVDRHVDGQFAADLLDEANDGIVVHDPETGEILACNDRFYTMLGYEPGTHDIELSDITGSGGEFTRSRAVSLIRDAADGESVSFEWRDPTRDGGAVWVEVKLQAAELDGEEYVVASVRNVSERKEHRQELRDSRDVLERLHEITGDPNRELDDQIGDILELGAEWYGTDIGFFSRIDADDGEFRVVQSRGDHPLIEAGAEHALEETYCRRTVDAESPVAIRDATVEMADDPAFDTFGLGCYLGTDIVVDGEQYGTLCFADEEAHTERFTGFDRTLLDHMADWLQRELERRSYVEEVEATQQQLTRTLRRIDDAFFSLGEDWRVRYANDAGADILRAAMGIEDQAASVVDRHIWEDIPGAVETTFYDEYHAAMREQESRTFEEHYAPLDVWFQVRAYPDEDGLSVYFTDITERKERERELYVRQRVLEEASLPLTLADPGAEDEPIVFANEAFEELTGYDAEEIVGRNCRFLQGPETDPETVAEIRAAVDAEETITTDIRNYRAGGTMFWNRLDITPIYDEDGTLLRYLGSQTDVTAERRARRVRQELLSTTETLMSADSRTEIAETVADAAVSILGHEVTAVYLDSESGLAPAAWSDQVGDASDPPPVPGPECVVRAAIERGEPVTRTDLGEGGEGVQFGDATVASALAVPLGDQGALAIGAASPDGFGPDEVDRAELLTVNATSALDRTERRAELERYETLFETVQDMLYVLDADGHIEMVSGPLAAALGYDADALRGEHVSTIMTDETVADGEALILDLLVTPDAVSDSFEGSLLDRDDEAIPVEIELSVLPYEGDFQGTVGAVRDISERQQREAELRVFRKAIAEAGIGLAMYDETGRFEYVNEHYAQLLGRTRAAAEVVPVWESLTTVTESGFDSYWASFAPGETRTTEAEVRRADGSSVPVETVTTAVEIDGTEHHLLTVQDVTDRRQRRQQSEVLHRIIRHNLRNDLTVVLGHARRLAGELDGTAAESARTIESTANQLRDLSETVRDAEDLLGQETIRRPVDVTTMLRDELGDFRAREDVQVEATLPESQYVLADGPLGTALKHLLDNAVEHSDRETATVAVDVSPATDRSGWVTIEIADDGPGIPEYETAVLTAGEETALEHGSGIGLWIVHWLITRYGGELSFRERPRGGSVVRIDLPAAEAGD